MPSPDKVNIADKLARFSARRRRRVPGVPRGAEHCPKADAEVSLMLFEPAGTVNTGECRRRLTVDDPGRI